MRKIIVSRHKAAIEWLKAKLRDDNVEVKSYFSAKDIANLLVGDAVYGNLPLQVVKSILDKNAEFYMLTLPRHLQRGEELSMSEMNDAGVKLVRVNSIQLEELQ